MTTRQLSLLQAQDYWSADPLRAFDDFVTSEAFLQLGRRQVDRAHPMRASSVKVYRAMFGKFHRWCTRHGHELLHMAPGDIAAFLDDASEGRPLTSHIRLRYVRLLERVYAHLGVTPNPARTVVFTAPDSIAGRETPTSVLTQEQVRAFLAALPAEDPDTAPWKRVRDRAILAVMLGAGLKVSEVIGLYVENVGAREQEGRLITVPAAAADGTSEDHTTVLQAFAVPELERWLKLRAGLGFPKEQRLLFPADAKSVGRKLDKATVYRRARKVFEQAGLAVPRRGGRTLRNTYGVERLIEGTAEEEVGARLGLRAERSLQTYALAARRYVKTVRQSGTGEPAPVPVVDQDQTGDL